MGNLVMDNVVFATGDFMSMKHINSVISRGFHRLSIILLGYYQ